MNTDWAQADSWWRRDVNVNSYLSVSRNRDGLWYFRWTERFTGTVIAEGYAKTSQYARARADALSSAAIGDPT